VLFVGYSMTFPQSDMKSAFEGYLKNWLIWLDEVGLVSYDDGETYEESEEGREDEVDYVLGFILNIIYLIWYE